MSEIKTKFMKEVSDYLKATGSNFPEFRDFYEFIQWPIVEACLNGDESRMPRANDFSRCFIHDALDFRACTESNLVEA